MTADRSEKLLKVLHQRQADITVVLENVHDPRNITAVMRTCEAVGIQNIAAVAAYLLIILMFHQAI